MRRRMTRLSVPCRPFNPHVASISFGIIIANSGITAQDGAVAGVKASIFESGFLINAVALIVPFQAALPLLRKFSKSKFFTISTACTSIAIMGDVPLETIAYPMLKVAVGYTMWKMQVENPVILVQP